MLRRSTRLNVIFFALNLHQLNESSALRPWPPAAASRWSRCRPWGRAAGGSGCGWCSCARPAACARGSAPSSPRRSAMPAPPWVVRHLLTRPVCPSRRPRTLRAFPSFFRTSSSMRCSAHYCLHGRAVGRFDRSNCPTQQIRDKPLCKSSNETEYCRYLPGNSVLNADHFVNHIGKDRIRE